MKDNDKKTLIIFIVLIVLIIAIFIFNISKNKKLENVDRKIEYIFNDLAYDNVYNKGSELFLQAIDLLDNKDVFEYEKDRDGDIKKYVINNYKDYKKIKNFIVVSNTLTSTEVNKYMELKNIIKHENSYYIKNNEDEVNSNYIGSIIDIDSYDDKYVYFKSINYYCDDYKYIGIINNIPSCNYSTTETNFTIVLENQSLRIYNLDEIKNIIK